MLAAETITFDAGPWVSVIGAIVMWTGFVITLAMLKNVIAHGVSLAVAEFLIRTENEVLTEKICRWLPKGDQVVNYMRQMDEKRNA